LTFKRVRLVEKGYRPVPSFNESDPLEMPLKFKGSDPLGRTMDYRRHGGGFILKAPTARELHMSICMTAGLRTIVAALALPVLASGCVSADALTPKLPPPTLDAALADVAHPALEWPSRFFGVGVLTPPIVPRRCTFDSASQYFVCPSLTGNGLTLDQRFTLADASGAKQSAFDATTTTSLHLENAVSGTAASSTVDGQQTLDLTGIGTARHTLNGTSLTLSTPTVGAQTEFKTTITDLVLPVVVEGAPQGWPLSGTVDTRSRSVGADGSTSNVFIATMRFDGSSVVTLTLTVPGGIETCRLNLATVPEGTIGCRVGSSDAPIGR